MNEKQSQLLEDVWEAIRQVISFEYDNYQGKLHKEFGRPIGFVKSIEARSLFDNCREWLTKDLESVVAPFTSASWLFSLRGCPDDYFQYMQGVSEKEVIEVKALAEVLTARVPKNSGKSLLVFDVTSSAYSIELDMNFGLCLGRLLGGIRLLRRINGMIRHSTTTEGFVFDNSDDILPRIMPSSAKESIQSFDSSFDATPFSRSAKTINLSFNIEHLKNENTIPLIVKRNIAITLPEEMQNYKYLYGILDLTAITQANTDLSTKGIFEKDERMPSAIYLALAVYTITNFHKENLKFLLERGLLIVPTQDIEKILQDIASLASAKCKSMFPGLDHLLSPQQVIKQMSEFEGGIFPLKAPPVIRLDNHLCLIDAANLYTLFDEGLIYPQNDGKLGALKGLPFEERIRDLISRTCWKPSVELKKLEGITIKNIKTREDLGDIDAIGEFENKLLIISCKNLQYTSELYTGEYKNVRNRSSDLEKYIEKWQAFKKYLLKYPKPENKQYDFSNYQRIIAIVCTPTAFIVKSGKGEYIEFDNITRYVSEDKLIQWLNSWCERFSN